MKISSKTQIATDKPPSSNENSPRIDESNPTALERKDFPATKTTAKEAAMFALRALRPEWKSIYTNIWANVWAAIVIAIVLAVWPELVAIARSLYGR